MCNPARSIAPVRLCRRNSQAECFVGNIEIKKDNFDYLGETERVKGTIGAGFHLSPRSFLLGQIVDDPRRDGFVYSAQAGMRFGALAPRAGVIESEFGAGVDLLAFGDRLMFSLDGFDFRRDGGPRLRLTTQFALLRYLHLVLGVDDFGSDTRREVYFGLGLGTR